MPNSPRKPPSRRSQDPVDSTADLFSKDPATDSTLQPPTEEWTLDDPSPSDSSTSQRPAHLPAQPIPAGPAKDFEGPSNQPLAKASPSPKPAPSPSGKAPIRRPGNPPPVSAEKDGIPEDPFEIDDELPAPSPPADAPVEADSPPSAPGLDTPSEAAEEVPDPKPRGRDKFGLATSAALLLALLALFGGIIYANRPASSSGLSQHAPSLPMEGKIVTLAEVDSGWRARQATDRVSTVDVTLPVPSRLQPALLPQVEFTCDPAAPGPGFLRFIFLDPDGKISGDVRVLKWAGGTLDPLSSGATLKGPHTAMVYGSLGFMDRPGFIAYASGNSPRWSVEVSESADYNAKEEGWTRLETFDIRNSTGP